MNTMMLIILLQVTTWIIHLAPVGVCFLIAGQILEMEVVSPHIVRSLKLSLPFHGPDHHPDPRKAKSHANSRMLLVNLPNLVITSSPSFLDSPSTAALFFPSSLALSRVPFRSGQTNIFLIYSLYFLNLVFFLVFSSPSSSRFIANMGNAIVTAFGTASSSATLPVTINALEEKNKVDSRISRSVVITLKMEM